MHIRRGDTVQIISGNDKGKRGRVLRVIVESDRLIVEGVRMIVHKRCKHSIYCVNVVLRI